MKIRTYNKRRKNKIFLKMVDVKIQKAAKSMNLKPENFKLMSMKIGGKTVKFVGVIKHEDGTPVTDQELNLVTNKVNESL